MKSIQQLLCPDCQSDKIIKNGRKSYGVGKQNYLCKTCGRQFINPHLLQHNGRKTECKDRIIRHLCNGSGIRLTALIERINPRTVLSVLHNFELVAHKPKQKHYLFLEVAECRPDELWTYVSSKKRRVWIIYLYCRFTGEIVAWTYGNRSKKTVDKLVKQLKVWQVKIAYVAMDQWLALEKAFAGFKCLIGKQYTKAIEGNNTAIRHKCRRLFRRSCCFSKKLDNHLKALQLCFNHINESRLN